MFYSDWSASLGWHFPIRFPALDLFIGLLPVPQSQGFADLALADESIYPDWALAPAIGPALASVLASFQVTPIKG
jgi:hypothetical protein